MENRILICYSFEKIDPVRRKQFDRKMFGTIESTHKGKYKNEIKGLLTNKEFRRPVRSVIIFDEEQKSKVLKLLKEFSAHTEAYRVIPA